MTQAQVFAALLAGAGVLLIAILTESIDTLLIVLGVVFMTGFIGSVLWVLAGIIWIGSVGYHEECTRGPGWQQPVYQPIPNGPPMTTWVNVPTEQRVREIVGEELVKRGIVVVRDRMD